ncbi:aldose epimerase family protein [Tabrizicola sp.]|uniref:aldose epimerase family protein n=1 Tax=Tabrizicola sp. TaxID=2005166 RepID=UPI0035AE7A94
MAAVESIGEIGGTEVRAVTLEGGGLRLRLLTWGARLAELWVPDRTGVPADIVLGQDSLADWLAHGSYLGATCGRHANRIAGGRFVLDGREVRLDRNEGANTLHGGAAGFDLKHWRIESHSASHVTFATTSPAGEMGFPGTLQARATYRLDAGLEITMAAQTDAPTVVNLVNHAYFNLAGQGAGDILGHELQVEAGFYLPVDDRKLPTGEVLSVAGTPFDFRQPRSIGAAMPGPAGFDHNLCLSSPLAADGLRPCLSATDPASGRRLRLATSAPGLQLYTGAHFAGGPGKAGTRYPRFAGFAAETQHFPDAPNRPHFPGTVLRPGQTSTHVMRFDFTPAP